MTPPAPRVVVVGAVNVDFVVAAERLPGPGETVVGPRVARHGGGKGANAAVAAARAGAVVALVGAVGDDDDGRRALEALRREGVGVGEVAVDAAEPTGVALIVVDPAGENQIAVAAGANGAVTAVQVDAALTRLLPDAGCVLVSTEIPGEAVVAAVTAAARAGVPCVLNPAPVIPAVLEVLEYGAVLTPNASELTDLAARLVPRGQSDDAVAGGKAPTEDSARALARRTDAPVVVTLGRNGSLVIAGEGAAMHVPPRPTTVRDTTGAGDTYNGVLAGALASGSSLGDAVVRATVAASMSVAHVGARDGMPTAASLLAVLAEP